MSRSRATVFLRIARDAEELVSRLEEIQAGDYQGRVSPIKHRLRDALAPIVEEMRALAREEYLDRGGKLSAPDGAHEE